MNLNLKKYFIGLVLTLEYLSIVLYDLFVFENLNKNDEEDFRVKMNPSLNDT